MSEFSTQDMMEIFKLAIEKDCSIYKAARYIYFWSADIDKSIRAYKYFLHEYEIDISVAGFE